MEAAVHNPNTTPPPSLAQSQKTKKKKNGQDIEQALFPCEMVICVLGGPATSGLNKRIFYFLPIKKLVVKVK